MTDTLDGNPEGMDQAKFHDADSILHAAAEQRTTLKIANKKVEELLDRFEARGKEN